MKKNIKRSRKKLTNSKTEDESSASGETKEGNDVISEQTRLSKQLEDYTCEFERRVEQLNFTPNEKDLVILYIMNLHPRWKRLVEPLELTLNSWKEAAHLARHHCAKASAILGAKRQDSLDILRSPETMALLSAGYFVPESHPFVQRYPGAEAVKHLIQASPVSSSPITSPVLSNTSPPPPPIQSTSSSSSSTTTTHSSQRQKASLLPSSPTEPSSSFIKTKQESTSKSPVKPSSPTTTTATAAEETILHHTDNTNITTTTTDKIIEKSSEKPSITDKISDNNNKPLEKTIKTKKITTSSTTTTTINNKNKKNNSNSICYRLPKEHCNVNLGFLELKYNDKCVKALLSKIHWFVSAISMDCVKRLGLVIKKKKESIKTMFSNEEPIGSVQFPIEQRTISLYVLPMIYNGKVDLVLGNDFFESFDSTLNIKARAIHYLDKEEPYSVSHLL